MLDECGLWIAIYGSRDSRVITALEIHTRNSIMVHSAMREFFYIFISMDFPYAKYSAESPFHWNIPILNILSGNFLYFFLSTVFSVFMYLVIFSLAYKYGNRSHHTVNRQPIQFAQT